MKRQNIKTKKEEIVKYWFFEQMVNLDLVLMQLKLTKDVGVAAVNIIWRDVILFQHR